MIHPRVCCDMEIYDFYQVAPKDVVLVTTHLEVVDSARREEVEASLALVERAVERLTLSGVDFILMNGVPLLMYHGYDGHRRIVERMRAVAKVPVTTGAQALVDAFGSLGAGRILTVSSWRRESAHLVANLQGFFAAAGIAVVAVEGIGEFRSYEKNRVAPAQLRDRVLAIADGHRDYDAIYIQSGTLATVAIIEAIERETGKPVVSSNSANAWACFKPFGIKIGAGFGRLLGSL